MTEPQRLLEHRGRVLVEGDRALVHVARELMHRSVVGRAAGDRHTFLLRPVPRVLGTLPLTLREPGELRDGVAIGVVGHRTMLTRAAVDDPCYRRHV